MIHVIDTITYSGCKNNVEWKDFLHLIHKLHDDNMFFVLLNHSALY